MTSPLDVIPDQRGDAAVIEPCWRTCPASGRSVLGEQMILKKAGKEGVPPGALFSYGYTLSEGWTNQSPPRS